MSRGFDSVSWAFLLHISASQAPAETATTELTDNVRATFLLRKITLKYVHRQIIWLDGRLNMCDWTKLTTCLIVSAYSYYGRYIRHWLSPCTCKWVALKDTCSIEPYRWRLFLMSESWVQTTKCCPTASRHRRTTERSQSASMCSATSPSQWTVLLNPTVATANTVTELTLYYHNLATAASRNLKICKHW